MLTYIMTQAENELAQIIWESEPVQSGQLVKLAQQRLGWKKSTTYTVLRKICENGIFKNEDTIVTSMMSREEYAGRKGENYLEENYNGSLPNFVASFLQHKKLNRKELEELEQLISKYSKDL